MVSVFYLDTSVVARALLGHSDAAAAWIDDISADEAHTLLSSRVLRTELTRVLRREGLPVSLRDEVLASLHLVPLTDGILAEAESIVPHVKTLDAIHLASLIATGLDATLVTHDGGLAAAAAIIGYPVLDPVASA